MFFFLHCKINLWLRTCLIKEKINRCLLAVGAPPEVYIFQFILYVNQYQTRTDQQPQQLTARKTIRISPTSSV